MAHTRRPAAHSGLTLLEMALILAVIALVAGAVLGGREMLRSAELRAAAHQIGELQQGIIMFRDVYGQLPGDFQGANALWAEAIDGDGDGHVNGPAVGDVETYNAWNHLSLAGLVRGTYRPHVDPAVPELPAGALPGTYVNLLYDLPYSLLVETHYLTLTTIAAAVDAQGFVGWIVAYVTGAQGGGLLPDDAAWLDAKLDDGLPLSGRVVSATAAMGADPKLNCPVASGDNFYNVKHAVHNCGLWIRLIWSD